MVSKLADLTNLNTQTVTIDHISKERWLFGTGQHADARVGVIESEVGTRAVACANELAEVRVVEV